MRDLVSNKAIELVRENIFSCKIVIIDGQGRSGKNMIAEILSTMPRVEKMRFFSLETPHAGENEKSHTFRVH